MVEWKVSELDVSHTGEMALYRALCEQARHEHMSDKYKDRYIIMALLETRLGTTDNMRTLQWFPAN